MSRDQDALQFDLSKVFPVQDTKPKPLPMVSAGDAIARILLANTDPVFGLVLYPSLVQASFEVVAVETGTDAIAELRKSDHAPVAIIDWKLPGMNGAEICQRMRDAEKKVYLILVADQPTTADIVSGLDLGADLFLPKTTPPEELLAYIKVGLRATSGGGLGSNR